MRDRTLDLLRSTPAVGHTDYFRASGAYCAEDNYTGSQVNGTYSRMVDEGTKYTDEIRTRYLEHHRSEIQSIPVDIVNTFDSTTCGLGTTYRMRGVYDPGYVIRGNPWILDGTYVQQELHNAFRFFESGCVEQETLLANFAWELPDVRRLWPAFRDLVTLHGVGSRKHRDKTEKAVAGAYLAYNFGVAPLIGDLIKTYDRLMFLSDHIAWLRKNSGQIVKVEYKASLPKPTASTLPSLPDSPPHPYGFYRQVPELRSGFKAWALITYDVSALTDLQLSIKTLTRAFGLNNPAAVIWEAIPYSFVVDWISNVGDLIERLEVPIKLPYVIHDCGYGVWVESVIEDWMSTWGVNALLRRTRTRGYSRRQGLPISISGLSLESPTAKQLSLGLALLAQKF